MRFGAGGGGIRASDALRFVSAVELEADMMRLWRGWGLLSGEWRFVAEENGRPIAKIVKESPRKRVEGSTCVL